MEFGDIRTIEGDTIVSPVSPRARIQIKLPMIYLGDVQYLIHQTRRAQEFLFIDVNSTGHVTRLLLVHFEGFLEGKEGSYDYPTSQTLRINGQDYLYDRFFVNLQEYINLNPDSDIARAADYIRQRAYTLVGDVVFQRFIHLIDAEKRNELVIAYVENNNDNHLTPEMLEQDPEEARALLERAVNGFNVQFGS